MTLFDEPVAHARRDDLDTSHEAAASIEDLRPRQRAVYGVVQAVGPATHEEVIAAYRHHAARLGLPAQTDQSIRSRCAELVDDGWIVGHDREGVTVNGRAAWRWIAVSPQLRQLRQERPRV